MRRNAYVSINPGETEYVMTAAMTTTFNLKLSGYRKQVINPPVAGIVAHGFEQLGPLVHAFYSILCDTKFQSQNAIELIKLLANLP
jgi:hypothetical protein